MKVLQEFNIPTPCVSNHASNLLELGNGDLLCTWFGGSMEGTPDVSVYLSRYDRNRAVWLAAQKVSDDPTRSEQNPALFHHPSGDIWLLYTGQVKTDQGTSIVRVQRSADDGQTWSAPEILFAKAGTFIRHAPVLSSSGQLILPVWQSNIRNAFGDDLSLVHVSGDGGRTWEVNPVPDSLGCVHMDILENCSVAFFRRRKADFVYRSVSSDGGVTWSAPEPTSLPNNNSSIQARELADGRIALIYNDISSTGQENECSVPPWIKDREAFLSECEFTKNRAIWGVPRNPLVISTSADLGLTWTRELEVEADPDLRGRNDKHGSFIGDYSYPSIIQTQDGNIQISYSFLRDYIKHLTIAL